MLLTAHVSFRLKRIMQLPVFVSWPCSRWSRDPTVCRHSSTKHSFIPHARQPCWVALWTQWSEYNFYIQWRNTSVFVRLFATMTKSALNSLLHDLPWHLTCSGTSPKYNSGVLSVVMSRPVLKSAGLVYDGSVGKSAGELDERTTIQRNGWSGLTLYRHIPVLQWLGVCVRR